MKREITIELNDVDLQGNIREVEHPRGWVIFAHGSGSSHQSVRNNKVAEALSRIGFSTLLFDLLTPSEDQHFNNRFNISLLAERLLHATNWLMSSYHYKGEPIAYFGASTGAAAALVAAGKSTIPLFGVISRGGRPDLVDGEVLQNVNIPVLLIVGGFDDEVIDLNQSVLEFLPHADLRIVEGATHLFEEPGTLEEVISLSEIWLITHLPKAEELRDSP